MGSKQKTEYSPNTFSYKVFSRTKGRYLNTDEYDISLSLDNESLSIASTISNADPVIVVQGCSFVPQEKQKKRSKMKVAQLLFALTVWFSTAAMIIANLQYSYQIPWWLVSTPLLSCAAAYWIILPLFDKALDKIIKTLG